jgi:hypothetical protein
MNYQDELKNIANSLNGLNYSEDSPSTLRQALLDLAGYKARVNNIMPELQYKYDFKLSEITEKILDKFENNVKGNSSYIKNYIESEMAVEKMTINIAERINSTIERMSENIRSVLSSITKELMSIPQ